MDNVQLYLDVDWDDRWVCWMCVGCADSNNLNVCTDRVRSGLFDVQHVGFIIITKLGSQ
jgi:hypothetical protein